MIERLMQGTAQRLEEVAGGQSPGQINERDHLAKCFEAEVADVLVGSGYKPASPGQRKCDFPDRFPRVGNVDALLVPENAGAPIWIELKCNSDPRWALADCGWDTIKCAVGLALGAAEDAFLVTGAPSAVWESEPVGADLFDGRDWTAEALRSTFAASFRSYERRGNPQPLSIPATVTTKPVREFAEFSVGRAPWKLRAARVSVPDNNEWWPWPTFAGTGAAAS